jgi:hypothetical protein
MRTLVVVLVLSLNCQFAEAQSLKPVLPLQGDPLQHSFYELEAAHGVAVAVSSGFDWSSYTSTVFAAFSTDGGSSWMQREFPIPKQKDEIRERKPRAIWIASNQTVWFGGDSGMLYSTSDLGQSWRNHSIEDPRGIISISFRDLVHGVAVGRQGLGLITHDGGNSWIETEKLSQYAVSYAHMFGPDSFAVWDQLQRMLVYSKGSVIDSFVRLHDPDDQTRVIGAADLVWLSDDRVVVLGLNQIQIPGGDPPFIDKTVIFRSRDAGRNFEILYDSTQPLLEPLDLAFVDTNHGAAVGRGKNILLTRDGGRTWSTDTLISPYLEFHNVAAIDENSLLVHGWSFAQGSILKYSRESNRIETGRDKARVGTHLYPNPSSGVLSITKWYSYEEDVRIIDIFGRTVLATKINREPGTSTIDCGHLPNGTYTVLIKYEGSDLPVGRFVLMK